MPGAGRGTEAGRPVCFRGPAQTASLTQVASQETMLARSDLRLAPTFCPHPPLSPPPSLSRPPSLSTAHKTNYRTQWREEW